MPFVLDTGSKRDHFDSQFTGETSKLNIRYKYVTMCISHRYKMRERESIYKYLEIRENELGERMNE